jgi:uncharacterized OsmC-like protein
MSEERTFDLTLEQVQSYEYSARLDWSDVEPIIIDEPEPLGARHGPNASRLVGAAVGHCLSASLRFCPEKAKQQVRRIDAHVVGTVRRNESGRWRIGRLDVRLTLDVVTPQPERLQRCLEPFEEYCVVTGSVRKGTNVGVAVADPQERELYRRAPDPTRSAQLEPRWGEPSRSLPFSLESWL